jgi:hypothetical protein
VHPDSQALKAMLVYLVNLVFLGKMVFQDFLVQKVIPVFQDNLELLDYLEKKAALAFLVFVVTKEKLVYPGFLENAVWMAYLELKATMDSLASQDFLVFPVLKETQVHLDSLD